jgi:hypothetical protein
MNKSRGIGVYGFGELLPPTVSARSVGNADVARFAIRGVAAPRVCPNSRVIILTYTLYYII